MSEEDPLGCGGERNERDSIRGAEERFVLVHNSANRRGHAWGCHVKCVGSKYCGGS